MDNTIMFDSRALDRRSICEAYKEKHDMDRRRRVEIEFTPLLRERAHNLRVLDIGHYLTIHWREKDEAVQDQAVFEALMFAFLSGWDEASRAGVSQGGG